MERRITCGCYVEVDAEETLAVVTAEAFVCDRRHKQGDRVQLGPDGESIVPDIHPDQTALL